MHLSTFSLFAAAAATALAQDQYGGKYQNPAQLPAKVDAAGGQFGWNDCVQRFGDSTKIGHCQNIFINRSVTPPRCTPLACPSYLFPARPCRY